MNADELSAGVRTVTQVGAFLDELKRRATELADQVPSQARGYFKPDEQFQVQSLLVAYWHSRNALLELISSYRTDSAELVDRDREVGFLTAFAAALLLVDAARFLRDIAHEKPIVREKLNEPAADFGIPPGTYDTVQRSLLSARHAWHLYHAVQYYQQNRTRLYDIARAAGIDEIAARVEQLVHHLDVSIAEFTSARLRLRANQAQGFLAGQLLGRALYGLQKLGGSLVADKYLRRGHCPNLPAFVRDRVRQLLAPGDILAVRKEYALTNYFLPGYWPHVALYLGDGQTLVDLKLSESVEGRPRWTQLLETATQGRGCVLESMKDGVQIRALDSPFASDSIVVVRPRIALHEIAAAMRRGLSHEGKPYDFDFDFRRADRLVCTEVVYRAYDGVGSIEIPLTRRAGRPTLSGNDLVNMALDGQHFDPVVVFAPLVEPKPLTGTEAVDLVRQITAHSAGE